MVLSLALQEEEGKRSLLQMRAGQESWKDTWCGSSFVKDQHVCAVLSLRQKLKEFVVIYSSLWRQGKQGATSECVVVFCCGQSDSFSAYLSV